jgi:HAD superfamily hydrolase (TIGR01509 family)
MIRGIIFDCFGVLHLDSNTAYFAQFPALREELHDLNVRADHGFLDKATYLTEAATITGKSVDEIAAGIAIENTLNRPLVQYISANLKPKYKVGLLSNIGRGWINDFFTVHQLHDLFDAVILSNEEGIIKPNPLVFERAVERLGLLPEECVMIDDRTENCQGAEEAGMKSIVYHTNEQLIAALEQIQRPEKGKL